MSVSAKLTTRQPMAENLLAYDKAIIGNCLRIILYQNKELCRILDEKAEMSLDKNKELDLLRL